MIQSENKSVQSGQRPTHRRTKTNSVGSETTPQKYLIEDVAKSFCVKENEDLEFDLHENRAFDSIKSTILGKLDMVGIVLADEEELPDVLEQDTLLINKLESPSNKSLSDTDTLKSSTFIWGKNTYGQLGETISTNEFAVDPIAITLGQNFSIRQVACGKSHILFVTNFGALFSMGNNHNGQLGLSHNQSKYVPTIIRQISDPSQICCGQSSSYALTCEGCLYSWGSNDSFQLGHSQTQQNVSEPRLVPLKYQIQQVSAGATHVGAITKTKKCYTWGSNNKGQLGHKTTGICNVQLNAEQVSCGNDYTIVLTTQGELMISGHLPFQVNNCDYLSQFEQLARFEPSVQVKQIESSNFTSIVAQLPGEERNELFLWGESPLGCFQEPTSLNQLINETQENQPQLDVLAVKNGDYFCVFIEKRTGLTFQLGSETMSNPNDDTGIQVALTELREVSFLDKDSYACGDFFVIGQGKQLENNTTPQKRFTPGKSNLITPPSNKTSSFTPIGPVAIVGQALSEIESQGLHEEFSSLPQVDGKTQDPAANTNQDISISEDIDSMQDLNQTQVSQKSQFKPNQAIQLQVSENENRCRLFIERQPVAFSACVSPSPVKQIKQKCGVNSSNMVITSSPQPLMTPNSNHPWNLATQLTSSMMFPPNLSQVFKQSIDLNDFQTHLKEQSIQFTNGALQEADVLRDQLDRTRKDYKRLVTLLDEEQDEVMQLRTRVKYLQNENVQLNQRYLEQQKQLQDESFRRPKVQPCTCSTKISALQEQLENKSKEIFPLTKNLGCLQSENFELKRKISELYAEHQTKLVDIQMANEESIKTQIKESQNKATKLMQQCQQLQDYLAAERESNEQLCNKIVQMQLEQSVQVSQLQLARQQHTQMQNTIDKITQDNLQFQKKEAMMMNRTQSVQQFCTTREMNLPLQMPRKVQNYSPVNINTRNDQVTNSEIADFLNQEMKAQISASKVQSQTIQSKQPQKSNQINSEFIQNSTQTIVNNQILDRSPHRTIITDFSRLQNVEEGYGSAIKIEHSESRLRPPTPIRNSEALDKTLRRIETKDEPVVSGWHMRTNSRNSVVSSRGVSRTSQNNLQKNKSTASIQTLQNVANQKLMSNQSKTPTPTTSRQKSQTNQMKTKVYKAPPTVSVSVTPRDLKQNTPRSALPKTHMQSQSTPYNRVKYTKPSVTQVGTPKPTTMRTVDNSLEEPMMSVPQQSYHIKPNYPNQNNSLVMIQEQLVNKTLSNGSELCNKLKLIQTNRELLEKKIMEYESKLSKIESSENSILADSSKTTINNLGVSHRIASNTVSKVSSLMNSQMSESRAILREQQYLLNQQ